MAGSDKTLAGYKLADLADEALSLVKALGTKQYFMVRHSMGGKVAQLAASRRPEGFVPAQTGVAAHQSASRDVGGESAL
jgi:pimeloyl-ACP methyl ester carboxylesterase